MVRANKQCHLLVKLQAVAWLGVFGVESAVQYVPTRTWLCPAPSAAPPSVFTATTSVNFSVFVLICNPAYSLLEMFPMLLRSPRSIARGRKGFRARCNYKRLGPATQLTRASSNVPLTADHYGVRRGDYATVREMVQ